MPTFKTAELLAILTQETQQIIQEVQQFQALSEEELRQEPAQKKWSMIQCIEHLNQANVYYLMQIEKVIKLNNVAPKDTFKTGFFGNIMVNNMKPIEQNGVVKIPMKMGTLATFLPKNQATESVFTTFFHQQNQLLSFFEKANSVNLSTNRVRSAVGSILQFRLGDCFRFIVAHNQRHLEQAKQVQLLHK